MSTPLARITRALQLLNVQAAGETVEASISADALSVLNDMLAEWEDAGFGFTATVYTGLTDAIVLPEADWECVAANLAVRIAPEYGRQPSDTLLAGSAALLSRLVSRYFKPAY